MKKLITFTFLFVLLFPFMVSSLAQQVELHKVIPAQPTDKYRINVELAKELIRAGNPGEALKLIMQLKDAYGDNAELNDLLKEAYLAGKEYDKAEELIKKDISRDPKNFHSYCELANVYLKMQKGEDAKASLNHAIQLAPDQEQTYREVASVYLKNGLTSEAMDVYKQARMKIKQPGIFAYELAGLYEAIKDYKQAVDEYFLFLGNDSTKFDMVEGRIAQLIQTDENLDGIQLALSERIKKNSQDRYSQKLYGDLLFRRKDFKAAFETYKKVDALWGAQGNFIIKYIQMCFNQKSYDQAILASQYFLSTNPPEDLSITAKLYVARSYEGQEKFAEAIAAYQGIIDSYSKLGSGEQRLFSQDVAFCQFEIGEIDLFVHKKPDEALSRYQTVVSNYPESDRYPDALVRLADCMMVKGDLDSAKSLYQAALEDGRAESKREEIRFKSSEIDFFRGNFEDALTGYGQVIADYPKGMYVNNSLERGVIINENQGMDRPLLAEFASALLDQLQNKSDSAIVKLDRIISAKSEKLSDLAELEKAKIYIEEKKSSSAVDALQKFSEKYPQSLYCDQAQKLIGDVYNYDLKDKVKAIQAYEKLLKDYQRSVYLDEVRDKLQKLKASSPSPTSG
ncbi:MAG: tetratricopeptide repeat protein [Candidatus Zixiibacteriota bacterium]